MPLDPFFAERLRVHRRYLLGQWLKSLRTRLTDLRDRTTKRDAPAPKPDAKPQSPSTRARAKHRRAALKWDRTELETVGTPGPDVHVEEHTVEVPGRPAVTLRIYYPTARGGRPDAPVPVWLSFFGGAFRIGGIDYPTTDAANRRRAADAGVAIAAVAYSLAPEHRFPTQIEQAEAALRWLHANPADLGLDPDRIGVMGTSAGGSIAAALTLVNRDRIGLPIRMQLLEVPVVDLTGRHIDLRATWALGIPSVIALRELRSVARTYLPQRSDAYDPRASPIRAESHAGLPEAVILTAEYDPLRGNGAAYAARLRAAGVEATCVRYLGVTHDVPIFTGALPASRHWHRDVVATLARLRELPVDQSRGESR
ncbi:alpha/beta hydrolase [Microbacterium sp. GXF7504]